MQIKNGTVFFPDGTFSKKNIIIENGKIIDVSDFTPDADAIDADGMYVVAGYIDMHIHGADGSDCCDEKMEALDTVASYLAKQGVTSFAATTMSLGEDTLSNVATLVKERMANPVKGNATIRGINMEGPFFCQAKRGAQNPEFIINPDYDFYKRINEKSGNNIKIVDIAPELEGSDEFIQKVSKECVVSIAHTEATYDIAERAFKNGAKNVTHLYNAMPPFSHREPGVVGAASDYAEHVELICDGIHSHPATVRSVFKLFGDDRVCIISDAMQACGLPDGQYELGGQAVFVNNGKAVIASGAIAGSTTNLAEGVRRAVKFGVPIESAFKAATINPAKVLGVDDKIGSVEVGKEADILLLDKNLVPQTIIIGGEIL